MIEIIDSKVYQDGSYVLTLTDKEMTAMDAYVQWIQKMRIFMQTFGGIS